MEKPKMIETSDFTIAYLDPEATHMGEPVYRDEDNNWRVDADGHIHLMAHNDGMDIEYEGETITPVDNGYGKQAYRVNNTIFGKLGAAQREIREAAKRPKVEWIDYRGQTCTKKTWPHGAITLHGFGKEFRTFNDFKEYVDFKFGPDVWTEKMDNIKAVESALFDDIDPATVFVRPKQREVIDGLAMAIIERDGNGFNYMHEYEYKSFSLDVGYGGRIYMHTVTGRKGDEGTAAELVCRTYRHMVIGKCGGVTDIGGNNPRHPLCIGWKNVLMYGGRDR